MQSAQAMVSPQMRTVLKSRRRKLISDVRMVEDADRKPFSRPAPASATRERVKIIHTPQKRNPEKSSAKNPLRASAQKPLTDYFPKVIDVDDDDYADHGDYNDDNDDDDDNDNDDDHDDDHDNDGDDDEEEEEESEDEEEDEHEEERGMNELEETEDESEEGVSDDDDDFDDDYDESPATCTVTPGGKRRRPRTRGRALKAKRLRAGDSQSQDRESQGLEGNLLWKRRNLPRALPEFGIAHRRFSQKHQYFVPVLQPSAGNPSSKGSLVPPDFITYEWVNTELLQEQGHSLGPIKKRIECCEAKLDLPLNWQAASVNVEYIGDHVLESPHPSCELMRKVRRPNKGVFISLVSNVERERGLFARKDFKPGEMIGIYAGELIYQCEMSQEVPPNDYTVHLEEKDWVIDAARFGNEMRFMNSGITKDRANADFKLVEDRGALHLGVVATRRIRCGKEILGTYVVENVRGKHRDQVIGHVTQRSPSESTEQVTTSQGTTQSQE